MATFGRYAMSRRRLIGAAATGSAGLMAAALVGCSSGAKKPQAAAPPAAANVAPAVPPKMEPKSGGILKTSITADIETLDRYRGSAPRGWSTPWDLAGSRMLRFDNGKDGERASGKIVGDLAASWEQPDPTTIVFKLHPGAKFDQRAPTNGRQVTSEDVLASWKRYEKEAAERTQLANSAAAAAPIASFEAIDPLTVRVKLVRPDVLAISGLAGTSGFWIQSTEGITGKFDQAKELRASGPFYLDTYRSGVGMTFKKNPQWHGGPKKPYLDGVDIRIIGDNAQAEVQFRAKNLHLNAVSPENIPQFAKELKGTKVVTMTPASGGPLIGLSWAPGQPWEDIRVRRALSLAMDRDAIAKVIFDPKAYEAIGVKLDTFWNTPLSSGWGAYWLDPKSKEAGASAQYLQRNVAEAKKLLEAAGYSAQKPLDFDMVYPGVYYGRDWPTRVDTFQAMAAETGLLKMKHASIDYTKYIAGYWRGGAKFEGINQKNGAQFPPGGAAASTALEWLISYFTPKGVSTAVADAWPKVDEMLTKLRTTTDFEASKADVHAVQRYVMENMIVVPVGPLTQTTDLVWEKLHGYGEIQGWPGGKAGLAEYIDFWMEEQI